MSYCRLCVNISGLLGFYVLTTNVTGHAALFAEKLSQEAYRLALSVGLWVLLFLAGAFSSAFYIRSIGNNKTYAYTVPIIAEIGILAGVGSLGSSYQPGAAATEWFAGSLLFAWACKMH